MRRHRAAWLLVAMVAATSACTHRDAPAPPKELELGSHRVQVLVPAGWDPLDQGAQKRFRKGEISIVLENLANADVDSALASLQDSARREVKTRKSMTIDGHE